MDAIRKFLEKKKKDAKFKLAGQGKKLTTKSSHSSSSSSSSSYQDHRSIPSHESKRAGAAALARFEHSAPKDVNWSLQAIKAQAKREMEAERKLAELKVAEEKSAGNTLGSSPRDTYSKTAPMLAVDGVYFYCPLIGPEIDSYENIKVKIRQFLCNQLDEDQGVASCLIIHTCNKNKEKVNVCIETLCKYIDNIVSNPSDEKYRKIRQSNRAYQDRIAVIEGTTQFLEAAGFENCQLPFNDVQEQFWVFPEEKMADLSMLQLLRDALVSAEAIKPQLDRSMRVLLPKQAATYTDLPSEFFSLTADELKKEMQQRSDAVERGQMLMTKVMREKMEQREMRKYRFSLVRIRFPDGIVLQGTFGPNEKFKNVLDFTRENLVYEWRPFFLSLGGGGKIMEEDQSLVDLHFVPAVLLNFEWDAAIQDPNLDDKAFLQDEILMFLQAD